VCGAQRYLDRITAEPVDPAIYSDIAERAAA